MKRNVAIFGWTVVILGVIGVIIASNGLAQVRQLEQIEYRDQAFTPSVQIWHDRWNDVLYGSIAAVGTGGFVAGYGSGTKAIVRHVP